MRISDWSSDVCSSDLYEWLTGERVDSPRQQALLAEAAAPLPVPATAIWSRSDGLVNGMICHAEDDVACRCIEVQSSHMGVQLKPEVLRPERKSTRLNSRH